MKIIYKVLFILLIGNTLFSCSKSDVKPVVIPNADTSKTLIADTKLVGNWAIVKDSVFFNNNSTVYTGVSGDHYKFTKYGNLYISQFSGNLLDTAIYTVSGFQVGWLNLKISSNGLVSAVQTTTPAFNIMKLDTANLVLQQTAQVSGGAHFEQITFKKTK
ncbi:MAG: hypothetical protein JO080_16380 [Mucilaginibacter sp.]|nr:hypothetical protein [Mucilaginibacter sp.]